MSKLEVVGKAYRHLGRSREVVEILAKHGFDDLVRGTPHPASARAALEELGPTFVKAGQYLSTRPDLLPDEYLRELAKLQDAAAPFDGAEAWKLVRAELGPRARAIRRFSREPLAAASVAQVHEAELADGTRVCVKVLRPGIRRVVDVDLDIMAHLAAWVERHLEGWSWRRPSRIVAELSRSLERELDLELEASHLERFERQFRGDETVRAPRVRRDLSSRSVLTLEKLEGIKADQVGALERAGLDPRDVARALGRHYLEMIFVHGFFHADPHPGNLLVRKDGSIAYLDFGMMGRLDESARERLADLVRAVGERDDAALASALIALSDYDQEPDRRAFQADVAELMDEYAYRPVSDWSLAKMLEEMFATTAAHRMRVPAEFFVMMKTLSELESLVLGLDPRFDVVATAAPFIRRLHEERASPARLGATLQAALRETLSLLTSAPADLRELLRQARRGRLTIEFEHKGLEPALSALDKASNRLAFAVVLGALVIGSSLLVFAGLPPHWRGVSALGLGGYLLSGLMSLWLLAAIVRHGRL